MNHESKNILKKVNDLCQDDRELEAEVLVKKQLATDPDNLELMTKLGEIQARLCNDHEAESTFRAVLVRNPNHEDVICGLGRLLDQALRTEEAEQIYRDFLQNNHVGHCALEDLCRLLLTEDRADEAFELARTQVERYGDNAKAYDALRYLLLVEEDRLDAELYDDREDETLFTQLMNNMLEQIELVTKMERLGELPDDLLSDLDDDKTRLISEIEQLLESAPSRKISVSSELHHRISNYKL